MKKDIIIEELNQLMVDLYNKIAIVKKSLEENEFCFLHSFLEVNKDKIKEIVSSIFDCKFSEKHQKFEINIETLELINKFYDKNEKISAALSINKIGSFDFELISEYLFKILKISFDKITIDYLFSFLCEFDSCKNKVMEISWTELDGSESSFIINSKETFIEYLNKYNFCLENR